MKRHLMPIMVILVLTSWLLVGCSQKTTTYYNREFGYSVNMPKNWEVMDKSVDLITGAKLPKNTVGFCSELSRIADSVYVEVMPGKSALSAVTEEYLVPNTEYKVHEYGKGNYIVYRRFASGPSWSSWRITYYIYYNRFLYEITFNEDGTRKKVYVSVDGYGKVNY